MAFKKGQSGNPAGRKPGTTSGAKVRKAIEAAIPSVLKVVIEAAKNGDIQAAKVLLDRICPPLKAQAQSVDIAQGDTLAASGDIIIRAALSGNVPPDTAIQLISALSVQAKIIETTELIGRIEALEAKK
ncbi:MAG: DUF5681 domain-containing protein [Methylococcaceae bacterium]